MDRSDRQPRYAFGPFVVDVGAVEVRRDGELVAMEPQVFQVLVVLLRERDRVVPKVELLDEIWGTRFVSESALTTRIKELRRALGDDGRTQSVIRTAHGVGFRFVADATVLDEAAPPSLRPVPPPAADEEPRPLPRQVEPLHQDIRFATTPEGTRLAYAWTGAASLPPLVKVANWLTHLEYDLESPVWRHWMHDLSDRYHLLRYDERGCGLSDLEVDDFSFDAWVRDLEVVVDAAGLDRFPLLGVSQGGAVAVAYAVRHPERVSHLVLYGSYARGPRKRATSEEGRREAELMPELAELGWGREQPSFRQLFTMKFLPHGSPSDWEALNELQRRTTTPANAGRFLRAFNDIDVDALAPQLTVPTLVLHARDDQMPSLAEGRRLAALIPGSRFVSLDSSNHLLQADEPAWPRFLDHVDGFLAR
ncbi:MAG: alpha/beta fold hydrolase [Aquihabitans sp.]